MNEDLVVKEGLVIPAWELSYSSSRSSGPGGQSVNKTNSRVTLKWHPDASSALTPYQKHRIARRLSSRIDSNGYVSVHAETARSQLRNKELARARLVELLIDALKPQTRRRATKPSRASKEKRLQKKRAVSKKKEMRRRPLDD